MITLKIWFNKNTIRPQIIIMSTVFIVLLLFLGFWLVYSKAKQIQQIDQLVRVASHGIRNNNRPLLESILNMSFHELRSKLIVICRNKNVILAYPAVRGRCDNLQNSLFTSAIIKQAYGDLEYTFYFLVPALPNLQISFLLLFVILIVISCSTFFTWRIQRKIKNEVLSPLARGLDCNEPLRIVEFEELRLSQLKYLALQTENAANKAMASLTKHLSHDVRKPLSQVKVILGAFDMFKSNPSRLEQARLDVGCAIKNVESMLSEVLDYSRESKLTTAPKSLGGVLDFVIRQVVQGTSGVDISFQYNLKAESKPFMDEDRFSRVLANIIGNGIEAITVIGKKESGIIDISTSDYVGEGSYVEIIIGNDGPAFPEGVEDKLFESFFTAGKSKGTGLGLASAKKIVQLHDGDIFARNKESGNGVEFIIRLPSSTELETIDLDILPKHGKDVLASKEDLKGIDALIKKMEGKVFKTILLEDETLYRAWVKNLIQGNDALQKSVVLYDATSVDEAIQLVEKEKATHAIVDIDLGGSKNGYDFLSEVKGNTTLKSIVHSNRTLEEFRQKAKDLGASGFVPKPLPLSSLVEFLTGEKVQFEESQKQDSSKMIYCCDDTQLIRDHLDFILGNYLKEKPGAFEFEIFINGEELIKKAIEVQPALVLSDLNMRDSGGQLNGYEVIKAVKDISRKTKAYLISNEPNQLSEDPTKEAGGDGTLEQPLNKDLLYSLLDKIFA